MVFVDIYLVIMMSHAPLLLQFYIFLPWSFVLINLIIMTALLLRFWSYLFWSHLISPNKIQILLRLFLVINMYCQLCKTCFLVLLRVKTFNPIYQKPQLLSIIARLICTMRIDLKVPCKIYPIFFQAGTLKTVVCHTYKSEKIRQVPWKNLDSFYRVDFTRYPSNHFSGCRLNSHLVLYKDFAYIAFWSRSHSFYYGKTWNGKKYPLANVKFFWHLRQFNLQLDSDLKGTL